MLRIGLRAAFLTSGSALALIAGMAGSAHAACTVNPATPYSNSSSIECVTFQDGANHVGDVVNASTGVISPIGFGAIGERTGISLFLPGTTITANIINNGTITSATVNSSNGIGVSAGLFPGSSVTGSVINNNQITVTGVGMYIGGSVSGDVVNNKNINSGFSAIEVTGTNAFTTPVTIGGSVINNGTITFTGDNANAHGITLIAINNNVAVNGDVSNAGSITITGKTAVVVGGVTVGGTVSNSGTITATGTSVNSGFFSVGMGVFGSSVHAVENTNTITADVAGIWLGGTSSVTTDVTNGQNGIINVTKGVGILVSNVSPTLLTTGATTISGKVFSQGTITAKTGIQVVGSTITGGISNTGNITGATAAIDLTAEAGATTINQQAGTITGNILLSTLADTVNVTGGAINGNIVGQGSSNTVNFTLGAGNTFTYANSITGVNAVNVNSGTVQLNGTIGANALTIASPGTLIVGAGGAIAGNITDNGVFGVNRTDNFTYGGVISGSGVFQQLGSGTTTLSGVNTYTGATSVNAGMLQAGAAGAFASGSAFTVASGATLALNSFSQTIGSLAGGGNVTLDSATLTAGGNNTSTMFSGVASGSGGLTKAGTGTTILTGANTYTGTTTISGGTLQLGNGGTSGSTGAGNVVDNGMLAINHSDSFTFANTISGTGGFAQNGSGTTILTGTDTYSGATSVNAGMLVVNGSIANSATTVNSGAVLSGIGTVGALTVKSGGAFAPGPIGATGTMAIAGNLAFQSGAMYIVQVTPSAASKATASGTATLAGTVDALFASGSYVAKNYTILSAAGGRIGTFDSLATSNLPFGFAASLSYTSTDAILNLQAILGTGAGLNQNQQNVANALNNFFNNGGAVPPGFVSVFGLTGANLGRALTLLDGEAATGAQTASFQLMSEFLGLMMDPFVDGRSGIGADGASAMGFAPEREARLPSDVSLAYASVMKAPVYKATPFEPRWTVWGTAFGGYNRTDGDPVVGSNNLTARTGGFAAGMDYRWRPDTTVGFALAGGGTGWTLANGLGTGKSDAFQPGVYGTTRAGAAYLSAALAYTAQWDTTDRVSFALDRLTARFDPQSVGGRVEGGYRYALPSFAGTGPLGFSQFGITPYAALQAQTVHIPAYNETDLSGGGFGLNFASRNASDTRGEVGARFDDVTMFYNMPWTLRARAAYAHDWVSNPSASALFQLLGPGSGFIVNGAAPVKDSALLSAGSELKVTKSVTIGAKFESQLAQHSQTYAGTGTVRVAW